MYIGDIGVYGVLKKKKSIILLMNRIFIRKHIVTISILLFVAIFLIISAIKPNFLYNKDGTLREFGLGYRNKTVIPMWSVVIILATLSYLGVMYYLVYPKIKY